MFLSRSQLRTLPNKVLQYTHIDTLQVSFNNLTSLPPTIGNLVNLTYLNVNHNRLTTLPKTIGRLKKLTTLSVTNNQLTSLPGTIGDLTKLENLYINNNNLSALPKTIKNLKNIKTIDIQNNPLSPASIETMRGLPKSVVIIYDGDRRYTRDAFIRLFRPTTPKRAVRVTNATNAMNSSFMNTRLSNIPMNKRAFINKNSNVLKNGTLRRVYNINGLKRYMEGKTTGRLHGGEFTRANITRLVNVPHTVVSRL